MTKYVKLYLSLINGNHIQPKLLSPRMSAGLKLRELAMATGIDQALLSKYENGSRASWKPTSACCRQFTRRLHVSCAYFGFCRKLYHLLKDRIGQWSLDGGRAAYALNLPRLLQLQKLDPPTRAALTKLMTCGPSCFLHQPVDATQKQNAGVLAVQYTYESNRIEGNTLTLGETRLSWWWMALP